MPFPKRRDCRSRQGSFAMTIVSVCSTPFKGESNATFCHWRPTRFLYIFNSRCCGGMHDFTLWPAVRRAGRTLP